MVIDACGCGAAPDAADYGDAGTNTLAHVAEAVGGLRVPALASLGLGSIAPIAGVAPAESPAVHGRLAPINRFLAPSSSAAVSGSGSARV